MSDILHSNIPNLILMVRPNHFGFNEQTAGSNSFQNELLGDNIVIHAQTEFDKMVDALKANKVSVHVFDDLDIPLPDAVFPNNWISHMPNGPIITFPMFTENRRAEVRPDIISWCQRKLGVDEWIDLTDRVKEELFLEGTGSMVIDYDSKVIYACISPRTNLGLLSNLAKKTGYDVISFESLDLAGGQIYHTNVMMSIGHHVVLICLDSVQDLLERMMLKESLKRSGKRIVELTYQQMNAFAGNALQVVNEEGTPFYVLSQTAMDVLTADQKEVIEEKSTLLPISIPTIEKVGGGSVRCMMTGLFDYSR